MYTIYLCDCQPYGECPCPWKSCNNCKPVSNPTIINKEEPTDEGGINNDVSM